jgi:uncharacterized membrane protein
MAMRVIIALAVVLLVIPYAYAQEVRDYEALVTIKGASPFLKNPGEVYEKVTIVFYNTQDTPIKEISYPFMTEFRNVKVYDSEGDLDFSVSVRGGKKYITVTFRDPLGPGAKKSITYEFGPIKTIQVREGNSYILTTAQTILANVKNFKLVIFLPEGYVLSPEGAVPRSKDILSDGRSVILIWEMQEPIPAALKGDFKVVVFYERVGWYPNVYHVGVFLAAVLVALIYAFMRRRPSKREPPKKVGLQGFLDILKEDEQRILKIIIDQDGIDQREIQRLTDFSKTKVSKILTELEKRGAIRKEPYGRRNKVFLTEKLKNIEQ